MSFFFLFVYFFKILPPLFGNYAKKENLNWKRERRFDINESVGKRKADTGFYYENAIMEDLSEHELQIYRNRLSTGFLSI